MVRASGVKVLSSYRRDRNLIRTLSSSIGKHWKKSLQDVTLRTTQTLQETRAGQAVQESVQAVQDSTTRVCVVCQTRMLRPVAATCKECNQPCCQSCTSSIPLWNAIGESSLGAAAPSLQVCNKCLGTARQRIRNENVQERMKRTVAFLEGRLEPYKYSPESKVQQSFRIGGHVLYGVKQVAGFLPVAGTAVKAVNAGYYIVRYGPLVLTGNDVVMCLQLLVGLACKLNLLPVLNASPQDFFGGLYYMMGENAGERGKMPELEVLEHIDSSGKVPIPTQDLLLKLRHLVRLLQCASHIEDLTPTDAQRLFKQVIPGSELVVGEVSVVREIPSYFVACSRKDSTAFLILPGTKGVSDLATDINAEEENVLQGSAHKGMVSSARWLLGEVGPVLTHLYTNGYTVSVVGHSLGAAIGALLTIMLRPQISSLMCYGFGMPACVDENLLASTIDCVVSVVNRDDLVPRLTVQNVEKLTEVVLCQSQVQKTKAWLQEDWKAVKDVERILELRRRENLTTAEGEGLDWKVKLLVDAGLTKEAAERALEKENGDITRALLGGTDEEVEGSSDSAQEASKGESADTLPTVASMQERFQRGLSWIGTEAGSTIQSLSSQAASQLGRGASGAAVSVYSRQVARSTGGSQPVGAQHLTRFYIPGQVVHLYQQNGVARAALASGTDDQFQRINVCQNMMEDHKTTSYDVALRQACMPDLRPPKWESFEERQTCACCGSDFNWAYVLQSDPQRLLARHHCYKCGRVVCDGCSKSRRAWPEFGAITAVRSCDSCIFSPASDEMHGERLVT